MSGRITYLNLLIYYCHPSVLFHTLFYLREFMKMVNRRTESKSAQCAISSRMLPAKSLHLYCNNLQRGLCARRILYKIYAISTTLYCLHDGFIATIHILFLYQWQTSTSKTQAASTILTIRFPIFMRCGINSKRVPFRRNKLQTNFEDITTFEEFISMWK